LPGSQAAALRSIWGPLSQVIHRVHPPKHVHSVAADTRVQRAILARP